MTKKGYTESAPFIGTIGTVCVNCLVYKSMRMKDQVTTCLLNEFKRTCDENITFDIENDVLSEI